MNFEAELRLVIDTFKKYGIAVAIADLTRPPSKDMLFGKRLNEINPPNKPLRELIHTVTPATVYTLEHNYCCFTYFMLPQLQPDSLMILGPYLIQQLSPVQIQQIGELQNMDSRYLKDLQTLYQSLPVFQKSSHLHLLLDAFFDRIWGVGCYTVETVNDRNASKFWPERSIFEEESTLISAAIMEERYIQENDLIEAVRLGQTRRVESFLARLSPQAFEQRVANPLRNLKNYCIITNTLLRKAAEQGGVHPIYIDSMSSGFAMKIEQLSSPSAGPVLIAEMAQAYCRLVRDHSTKGYSPPIQKAIILIEGNLAGNLSLAKLAQELNVNSSYLSTLFKKETGHTFTAYINQRRITQAKHLLRTTSLQVQTIAQHCGIWDFHYFCRVFKNSVGKTPTEYRNDYVFD